MTLRIGTAGWVLPRQWHDDFPPHGSHLERYAARFSCAEINSSFYREHRRSTYHRWAESVPSGFRFAVKLPRAITHDQRLVATDVLLDVFLDEISGLGGQLGPLLIQLPPSLAFDEEVAASFVETLRALHTGDAVVEPRHPSWFDAKATALLAGARIARAAADPACVAEAAEPGAWDGFRYTRLHGSPRMYYSAYSPEYLDEVASRLEREAKAPGDTWCLFDNTASGAAAGDALALARRLGLLSHTPD